MINRKSLAIIIPILLSTGNEVNAVEIFNQNGNKLELYGFINPNHEFSHSFLSTEIVSHDDNTNSILGFSGNINITEDLLSYAKIEYKTDLFAPEDLMNRQQPNSVRLGYAGFKYGDWGSIDYGRNYGIMHDAQSITNRIPYVTKNSVFAYNDNYMINRNNSLLTYRNDNFFGLSKELSFVIQYQDKTKDRILSQQNNSGWGASIKYKSNTGLTAIGSFFSSHRPTIENKSQNVQNIPVDAYGLGIKYNANNIYIAAFYGAARNLTPFKVRDESPVSTNYINTTENIEAIAEYSFNSGLRPSLSYLDSKGQNNSDKNSGTTLELAKQISIATRFDLNENISTYVNYKINLLKENDFIKENKISTENVIGAGIVYQF